MATGSKEDHLRQHYASFAIEQLEQIAFYEVRDLTADAIDVLRLELRRRKRPFDYDAAIDLQLAGLGDTARAQLYERLTTLPCPNCGSHANPLNAALTRLSVGLVLFHYQKTVCVLSCPSCLRRIAVRKQGLCALFGWWSVPAGVQKNLAALAVNRQALRESDTHSRNLLLQSFITKHAAHLTAKMKHTEALQDFLRRQNRLRLTPEELKSLA
ncbi:MAG TPA: hypothetical protein PKN04_10665 [bacterium]|jgi:predicted RNA-binding Zn-ribbon protein involved in translation (DUF1610 family)|nr:hypothetical protein [bacterium]HNT66230.1 hypothetical protein [bacterium]HOX85398.1 hypothetical protein [bacterium]HPG44557.1 hypothetical protein [bacterium]HPM97115.1 hypothetical protein [bacterium]